MFSKFTNTIVFFACFAGVLCACAPQACAAFPFFEKDTEQSLFNRAKKAYDDGFYDVAAAQFARFVRKYPGSKLIDESTVFLGGAHLFSAQYADALKCFQKIIDTEGTLKEKAMYLKGVAFYRKGDFRESLECFDRLTGEFPGTAYRDAVSYTAGKANYHLGQYDRALALFDALIRLSKDPALVIDAKIASGRTCVTRGDFPEGLAVLLALRKEQLTPAQRAEAGYWTGIVQHALGRYKEAAASFEEQIKTDPPGVYAPESLFRQAQSYIEMSSYAAAQESLRRLIDKYPKSGFAAPARLLTVKVLILKGAYDDAAAYIQKNFAKRYGEPYDTTARLLSAYAMLHKGEYKKAFEKFRKLAAQSRAGPMKAEAYAGMGEALFMRRKFREAAAHFDQALRAEKDPARRAQAEVRLGDSLFLLEDYAGAVEKYDNVLARSSFAVQEEQQARIYLQTGISRDRLREYEQAIDCYKKVRDVSPSSVSAVESIYREGLALCALGRYDEAVAILSGLLKKDVPAGLKEKALLKTAQAYFNLKQYPLAARTYARLVDEGIDKDLVRKGIFELGWAFSFAGNAEEALKVFNKFVKRYPAAVESPEAYFWIAEHHYGKGEYASAQKLFDALVAAYPRSDIADDALFWGSRCASRMGNNGQAVWYLKRLNSAYPHSPLKPDALFCIGDALAAMKRFKPAMKYFRKVLREYPGGPLTYDACGRIGDMCVALGDYRKGLRAFTRVLSSPDAKSKAQAIFKAGVCYAALGEHAQAQEQFLKIVYDFPDDHYWFSKAAFKAAGAYESAEDWINAVKLYQKVAASRADRYEVANERIEKIKGEHGELFNQ
jgi:TolA-binding protein